MPATHYENLQASPVDFERDNTVCCRAEIARQPGIGLCYAFRQPDGAVIYYDDPLPRHEFARLGDWVLQPGEEIEITVRRHPRLHRRTHESQHGRGKPDAGAFAAVDVWDAYPG